MQRVLLSATTVPTYTLYPGKFYIYSFMKVAVGAGLSLVPLYMGYHYQKIANIKVLRYLSSFFLLYMVIALTNKGKMWSGFSIYFYWLCRQTVKSRKKNKI
ncbi:hypothetical protein [Enterococcus plantarum]|uniref:hypothetical protein n=1 Tax=Enterococcus plantarum TaxID=1077675 RepID=UPI0021ACDB70|nr:hypothetical protein [Enterococcus plantarum]